MLSVHGVISGVHLFTFLAVCHSLFVFLINYNSLLFTQSPCEYNPCRNGVPCVPLYRSNSYLCMLRPGKIEQGRINIELQIYKELILVLRVQTYYDKRTMTKITSLLSKPFLNINN